MRQARGAFRGTLIVGSTLIVAFVLGTAAFTQAFAQARNNQPPRPRAEQPPSGHQTEAVDLNEGKSAAELFKAGCAVCHQSAAGLAKGRRDSELVGFLRQHYTSGTQHAASLAAFLAASGGRGGPAAAATPARLNPNAPIERPPAPVGREEAARPQEREPASKRKPPVAARPAPPAPPAPPAAPPAAATEAAAHAGDAPAASAPPPPPVEEKPPAPEIPL